MIETGTIDAWISNSQTFFQLTLLVAARVVPMVQLLPFLGGAAVPQVVKMGLSFSLTLLLVPVLSTGAIPLDVIPTGFAFAACVVKETTIGFTLGFIGALVFEAVRVAGQIIDQMRGQTMANVMVPQLKQRTSVTANFLYQFVVALFLVTGGHLLFVRAMIETYVTIGPFAFPTLAGAEDVVFLVARLSADAITVGVMFALPVIVAILLADILLGMLNKAAPQINVFFLGMPIKAMLGVGVLFLCAGVFAEQFVAIAIDHVAFLNDAVGGLVR